MKQNKILRFTVPGRPISFKKKSASFRYQRKIKTAAIVAVRRRRWKVIQKSKVRAEITIHCKQWDTLPNILGVARNIVESISGIVIGDNWGKIVQEVDVGAVLDEKESVQIAIIELSQ